MAHFIWGMVVGFILGVFFIASIADALSDPDEDGFCHCLRVRKERTSTDGRCDLCGRMVDLFEMDDTRSVTVLTEKRNRA